MIPLDEALWPRAALPRRPMLGAVLDALTAPGAGDPLPSYWCSAAGVPLVVSDRGRVVSVGSPYHSVRYPWVTANVAEAYELLQARDLVPMGYVGRFVCDPCAERPGVDCIGYFDCHGTGALPHPPTVAALASWASLGWEVGDDGSPGILGAEEWAWEMSRDAPMWRVSQPRDDAAQTYRNWPPVRRLCDAGLGWARVASHAALYVPPLGLVTP